MFLAVQSWQELCKVYVVDYALAARKFTVDRGQAADLAGVPVADTSKPVELRADGRASQHSFCL